MYASSMHVVCAGLMNAWWRSILLLPICDYSIYVCMLLYASFAIIIIACSQPHGLRASEQHSVPSECMIFPSICIMEPERHAPTSFKTAANHLQNLAASISSSNMKQINKCTYLASSIAPNQILTIQMAISSWYWASWLPMSYCRMDNVRSVAGACMRARCWSLFSPRIWTSSTDLSMLQHACCGFLSASRSASAWRFNLKHVMHATCIPFNMPCQMRSMYKQLMRTCKKLLAWHAT